MGKYVLLSISFWHNDINPFCRLFSLSLSLSLLFSVYIYLLPTFILSNVGFTSLHQSPSFHPHTGLSHFNRPPPSYSFCCVLQFNSPPSSSYSTLHSHFHWLFFSLFFCPPIYMPYQLIHSTSIASIIYLLQFPLLFLQLVIRSSFYFGLIFLRYFISVTVTLVLCVYKS